MQTTRYTKFNQWETTDWSMPRVFYGGGKSQQSTSQVSIPPEILGQYENVNSIANQVAQTPFQQYSQNPDAFVAPLTATQQAGILGTNQYSNEAQPFYQKASNLNSPSGVQSYYNPEASQVGALMEQQFSQAQSGQLGNAIQNGAFGGDRAAVTAANLQQQQGLAYGNTMAGIYNQAVGNSQNAANLEANIGSGAQASGLAGAQAQLTAGQAQQQTEQAGLTALYNQFLQQQSYPFQTTQFLANIAEGTGALSGSTTTSNQPAPYFSDERLKEDIEPIGETYDGHKIIKFRYKGDKQKHIGLSAQDVEKTHPHAVGLSGGYKTVDYDAATEDAAERGRSHAGGLVDPIPFRRRDGSVVPERRNFDFGGYAGLSPNSASAAGFILDPSYLQAQEAGYANAPWGNAGPVSGSAPYGGKSHVPPSIGTHGALAVAKTPSGSSGGSGLQQLSQGIGQLEGLGKTGKSLFNDAKGYIPGLGGAANSNNPPPPVQMPPDKTPPTASASAPGSNTPPPPTDASAGPVAGLDPSDVASAPDMDLADLGDDLGAVFSKRGGRIARADGGSTSPFKVSNDIYDSHRGEQFGTISASHTPTGRVAGAIDYSRTPQSINIKNIETHPDYQRQGVARSMMDHLKNEFPHHKVYWGGTTPEGEQFKRAYYRRADGGPTFNQPTDSGQDDASDSGDVPYDSGTGSSGLDIPDDKSNNKLAVAQPPQQQGGGGGFNPLGLITGALGLFGLKDGGRVGLADGGDPGDMPLPTLDDAAQPGFFDQGKAPPVAHNWGPWHAGGSNTGPIIADPSQNEAAMAAWRAETPKSAPKSAPKQAKAGLNPDAPSPDAQPVQMVEDMGSGQHLTQPGEVLTQDGLGGVGDFLNRNQGLLVPILHGLGTMASSNSRYLGSAILQGLGGAADSYENVQNEMQGRLGNQPIITQRNNDALQSDLNAWQSYTAQTGANLSFADFERMKAAGRIQGNVVPQPASNGAGQPYKYTIQEKNSLILPNGVPANQDPAYLAQFAQHNAGIHSEMVAGQVHQANQTAGDINAQNFTYNNRGQQVVPSGYSGRVLAQKEPDVQSAQGAEFRAAKTNFLNSYQPTQSLLTELGAVYQGLRTGPTADVRARISKLANDLDPDGKIPLIHNLSDSSTGEDYDTALKDIAQITAQRLGGMSQNAPKSETELLSQFAANPDKSPGTVRDVIIRGQALLNQQRDYYKGYDPFRSNQAVSDYTDNFYENHPFEGYRGQLEKTVPAFAGEQPNQRNVAGETQAPAVASPPGGAVAMLRAHPELAPQFDAKYGAGASKRALGQ